MLVVDKLQMFVMKNYRPKGLFFQVMSRSYKEVKIENGIIA